MHLIAIMPTPPRPPSSYDEIARRTVPEPDTSWRPTREQEERAVQGGRAIEPSEQELHDRVRDALCDAGADIEGILIEVVRDHVTLRGQVADERELARVPEIVAGVAGVTGVDDYLVVVPPGSAD